MAANLQHLRAFHAIAVEGGVTRAARRLNVSQPTLSQQLKALEARHGVSLFDGRTSPMKLTAAGRDLMLLTQRLFATAGDIDELLGETGGLTGGVLRLGSDTPLYAARVIASFRRHNPQTGVVVRTGNAREVVRWLSEAQIDAAVASDPPGDANFSYEPLYSDGLSVAVPAGHLLAGQSRLDIVSLAGEVLLLREAGSKTRALTERALADAAVEPMARLELHGRELIREAIALNLGVSVFLASECPPDPRLAYASLDCGAREYRLQGYLLCQTERRRSTIMRALQSAAVAIRDEALAAEPVPQMRLAAIG